MSPRRPPGANQQPRRYACWGPSPPKPSVSAPHLVRTGRELEEMLTEGQRSQGLPEGRQGPRDMRQMASEMPEAGSLLGARRGQGQKVLDLLRLSGAALG